ncbi:MAG: HAMP domain-containing histidine kinase [Clostridiales bacterium]|nr:HAMP domain-containing histidine kinase [Clostridiales bacterium]
MKHTVLLWYILSYIIFIVLAFTVLLAFAQQSLYSMLVRQEAQKLYRESALIASDYAAEYTSSTLSLEDFQSQMSAVSTYLSADIWVVDREGRILFESSDESIGQSAAEGEYAMVADFDATDFGNQYYMVGNFYGSFSSDMLTVFSPVTSNYRVANYVLVHKSVSTITSDSVNGLTNTVFYTVALVVLCSLLTFILFFFGIYLPLRKISRTANAYAKGDFSQRVKVRSTAEIGHIAGTMNYMADELMTLEDDQRKFISNVSHDFRSPLTSIKGYVEAMLDGTIPPEGQEKYLNIILFETERLNKLTQSLIDLNRFGSHGMMLDVSDFDINSIIKTTILTFEGTCEKKHLTFDLVLTGQELFVTGDMSKIQQVLYNLIDNATKFSNNDSAIKIETSIKNEKVLISVKDSGIGIPADSIKKIWDRFYKTDLSRGKDKRGSGLGLAIVKEIVQAHGEHINVISTEGAGTEFIFTLPLAQREVQ